MSAEVAERVAEWVAPVEPARAGRPERVRARGRAILARCGILAGRPDLLASRIVAAGVARDCREGLPLLLDSIAARDAARAGHACAALLGLGQGLTPEGDDLVACATAVVWSWAPAAGWAPAERHAWLAAVAGSAPRERTTELSSALLHHAARGEIVRPLHPLLDLGDGGARGWLAALRELAAVGATTGPTYVAALGAAAFLLPTDTKGFDQCA